MSVLGAALRAARHRARAVARHNSDRQAVERPRPMSRKWLTGQRHAKPSAAKSWAHVACNYPL